MVWYLPHHFVEYPNKPEKISVVMDWAASFSQVSLNNQLFLGPPLLPKLVSVLLRSSKCLFALSADIVAFYHRVGIPAKHKSFQRFVFREFLSRWGYIKWRPWYLGQFLWVLQHAVSQNKNYPKVVSRKKKFFCWQLKRLLRHWGGKGGKGSQRTSENH